MTQRGDTVIAHGVEISLAIRIEQIRSFAAHQRDVALGVERKLEIGFQLLDRVERQHRGGNGHGLVLILVDVLSTRSMVVAPEFGTCLHAGGR